MYNCKISNLNLQFITILMVSYHDSLRLAGGNAKQTLQICTVFGRCLGRILVPR